MPSNDHYRQRRPDRRFRRLIPAAVAAATIAASAPFAASADARPTVPQRAHVSPPPGKIAALPPEASVRGEESQRTSAT
jgi:hypothetical protein